jgi:hypothetical protein
MIPGEFHGQHPIVHFTFHTSLLVVIMPGLVFVAFVTNRLQTAGERHHSSEFPRRTREPILAAIWIVGDDAARSNSSGEERQIPQF